MSVRVGRIEDLDAIIALERASEGPHWAVEAYREVLTGAGRRRIFVWDQGEGIVAFSAGMVMDAGGLREGEIEHVVVARERRRQGIGRRLCEVVLDWAGAAVMRLEVRASNHGAIGLYRGIGFAETRRRKAYYRDPIEDAVLMERDAGAERCGSRTASQ